MSQQSARCETAALLAHVACISVFFGREARRLERVACSPAPDCCPVLPHRAVLGVARRLRQSCLCAVDCIRLSFCLV